MIRLARGWYNFVADFHDARALAHARRRDRALRQLERLERRQMLRQREREHVELLQRLAAAARLGACVFHETRQPQQLARADDIH